MTTAFSWEIDFNDDDFATAADVTLDVQNYRLRIALDTEQDEAEFVDIAASGKLVLTNKSRDYSPDSLTSPYADALRSPHACRRVGRFTVAADAAPSFTDDTGDAQQWYVGTEIAALTVPAANGSPAPTYSASGLPTGISFDTTSRVISGAPTAAGAGTIVVTATNSEGSADWTATYTISTPTAPTRPAAPALVVDSDTEITATGVEPDDGGSPITSYDWRHRVTGSGNAGWVNRSNVVSLIQSFSGLTASTEYDFQFRATNNVGASPRSLRVSATTNDQLSGRSDKQEPPVEDTAPSIPEPQAEPLPTQGTTHTEVLWEGVAHAPTLTGLTGVEFAEFDLRGALTERYDAEYVVVQPGVRTLDDIATDLRTFAGHTPSTLAQNVTLVDDLNVQGTQGIAHEDSFRAFLVDVARYAGGIVIFEDPVGRLGMISLIRTRLLVSNIPTIDYRDHRILTRSQLFARRDDLVRNRATLRSVDFDTSVSETLSELTGSLVANGESLFEVFTTDDSVVFADWPDATTINGVAPLGVTAEIISSRPTSLTVRLTNSNAVTMTFSFALVGSASRQATSEVRTIDVSDSQDIYDVRRQPVPGWFTNTLDFESGTEWIEQLANAPPYSRPICVADQRDTELSLDVARIRPGNIANFILPTPDGVPTPYRSLVLGMELNGGARTRDTVAWGCIELEGAFDDRTRWDQDTWDRTGTDPSNWEP